MSAADHKLLIMMNKINKKNVRLVINNVLKVLCTDSFNEL